MKYSNAEILNFVGTKLYTDFQRISEGIIGIRPKLFLLQMGYSLDNAGS